ncbi:Carbon monoxide dehydrogenase subunit G [Nitrosovibrio tenuis]|uniref:Carbon monoxide dehydrogenase subunit G n=2 Tax=Nitrosovibrio tenuis TaxID=1233 RepID=A0A1H7QHL1_9PROT|nr:Carbon monoxide dehydrogenase subunit G [Nitrosovibrio tenuis]
MRKTSFLLLMWSVLFMTAALADPRQDKDIDVKVHIAGESVIVDVTFAVPATRQEVWVVLTDFEHMADFVSNLKESKVVSTSGNTLKIFQRGTATYGPISFPFESTREIRLIPFEKIRSHMISGNMRMMDGTTQLIDEGGQTRIIYHTDTIQERWIPPIIGKVFIEHEIRKQFHEMRNEIIKRKRASASSTPTRSSARGI